MQQQDNSITKGTELPERRPAQRVTVSLSPKDHSELAVLAERCDVSLSWLMRQAVSDFLDKHAKGKPQLPLQLEAKKLTHHG